ncbi:hypothetical protein [Celeribacter naphthalenivorans]|uniref:hypothetical protein n=1 Tax=Celeribacter naphthalenivorans TaxID=1614694 RepID=UPI001CFA8CDC|nr:hypothetical protein [Celeribacter naphthalenivorans]
MGRSIKGHPFQERLKAVPLKMAASFVSDSAVEDADKATRAKIFREFGRLVIGKHKERRKYGFNSDPGGEIARGLEQAFQAGLKAASHDQEKPVNRRNSKTDNSEQKLGPPEFWKFSDEE